MAKEGQGYIFWGMGNHGKMALEKYKEIHLKEEYILGVYDSGKQGECYGYPIIKIDESGYKQEMLIITVDNSWLISEIYNKAKKLGYKNIFWFTFNSNVIPFPIIFIFIVRS